MMASRSFTAPARSGTSPLDLSVAALAGISVAFVAFAVPSDLLAELVGATGLPSILSTAEPPLGTTARVAIGSVGAVTMFVFAFALLRWLDRFSRTPRARPFEAPVADAAPRQRRRDAHPDAPPRPPISATRDFGEPFGEPRKAPAAPETTAAPEPAPQATAPSITDLMARLERGMARRAGAATPASAPTPAPQVFPDAGDDRLQSAIDGLQRLAWRRDQG